MENVADIYPLSPVQQGMLFHTLAEEGAGVYVEQYTCTLGGPLRVDRFREAWEAAVARHPSLRTAFLWEGLDEPLQVVRRQVEADWAVHDWQHLDASDVACCLEAYLQEDRTRGFEPAQAPLMRMALFRTGPEAHRFVWTFHHLLLDGWSTARILAEVFTDYAARCRGHPAAEPSPRPFRDYIAWLQQQDLRTAEAFWAERLRGFTTPTALPFDPASVAGEPGPYARRHRDLSGTVTTTLQAVARRQRLTLNTLVQGAWALLLSRYSGERDIVYGTTVSGRPAALAGVEEMVGSFISTLPMRVRLADEATLPDWLRTLQAMLAEAQDYAFTPLMQVQQWSEVPAGRALFDSLVVFENYPLDETSPAQEAGLHLRDVAYLEQSNYPLALLVLPGAQLHLEAVYDTHRFQAAVIDRMLGHLTTLLAAIAQTPTARLDALPLLTEAERRQQLVNWNPTAEVSVSALRVHDLIERQAARVPEAPAVCFEDEVLTYAALDERANRLAAHLRALGVGPDVRVGLFVERSIEMVVGILGILKAGGAYVPLDPVYPDDRLRYMIQDAGTDVVVTVQPWAVRLPSQASHVVCLDAYEDRASLSGAPPPQGGGEHLAYVIYTSGSTGRPKGVAVTHRNLMFSTQARVQYYRESPRCFLLLSPYSFDSSVAGLFWTLATGGTLVLPRPGEEQEVRHLAALIARHAVTHTLCVPALYTLLLKHAAPGQLAALRTVIVAGEACPASLPARHHARLPAVALYNEYGPTETTVWATVHRVAAAEAQTRVPIGLPIPGAEAYVLDDAHRLVPVGVPGELYVGGPGVTPGYLQRADLTAERFVPHPFREDPAARLYRTGDRVRRLEDGTLDFLGRVDDQVKLRGYRIELTEIEEVLRQHTEVEDGAVVLRVVRGTPRLVAYVVPRPSSTDLAQIERGVSLRDVRAFLERHLPLYMVPTFVELLQTLPRTPNGKVDRHALPDPAERHMVPEATAVPPGDPFELQMIELWEDVLGIQGLSMTDNFFDAGGDSLLAVSLMLRIEEAFEQALPISMLFRHPTPRALIARLLDTVQPHRSRSPVPMRSGGVHPPLFCVPGSGGYPILFYKLARYLGAEQPVYSFEPRGVDGRALPYARIEDMAAQHVAEMRRVQPEGPYFLCGYSVGGLVAYEMAQQLRHRGDEVALLALLDTHLPYRREGFRTRDGRFNPGAYGKAVVRVVRMLKWEIQYRLLLRQAHAYLQTVEVMPKAFRNSFPAKVHERAARRYVPASYPGPVHLFSSGSERAVMNQEGWRRFVDDAFTIHTIASSHGLVQEPYVGDLAQALTACLRHIREGVTHESHDALGVDGGNLEH